MTKLRYDFASDNVVGAAPEAMAALVEANRGQANPYGGDEVTARACDLVRALLDCDAEVHFVSTGTAANALALSALCRSFESILSHRTAHILTDEAGAPGFFSGGARVLGLDGEAGLIAPGALQAALAAAEDPRHQPAAALSLTQTSEYGALYDRGRMADLVEAAKSRGLAVHVDGARLANAAAAGFDPRDLGRLGVDIVVVGGSKAGMPPTEAVAILNPKLAARFRSRLKQAGQLTSKARFLAAPWVGMLSDGAWLAHARHANAMARRLAGQLPQAPLWPVETNMVFAHMSPRAHRELSRRGWVAHASPEGAVRLVCSWATQPDDVDRLAADIRASVGA